MTPGPAKCSARQKAVVPISADQVATHEVEPRVEPAGPRVNASRLRGRARMDVGPECNDRFQRRPFDIRVHDAVTWAKSCGIRRCADRCWSQTATCGFTVRPGGSTSSLWRSGSDKWRPEWCPGRRLKRVTGSEQPGCHRLPPGRCTSCCGTIILVPTSLARLMSLVRVLPRKLRCPEAVSRSPRHPRPCLG